MKRLPLLLVLALAAAAPAPALTYHGTITQTITETNDPLYRVGQQFFGRYVYQSEEVDGTFSIYLWPGASGNETLTGYVHLPFDASGLALWPTAPKWDLTFAHAGSLSVAGGQVTGLDWTFFMGDYYGSFGSLQFGAYHLPTFGDPPGPDVITRGTVAFTAPVVPETGATLGLLACGLLGCGLARRRRSPLLREVVG